MGAVHRRNLNSRAARVDDQPTVEELEHLCVLLTRGERDDLLQELLVAAAHGGEAMTAAMNAWLLDRAGREFLDAFD